MERYHDLIRPNAKTAEGTAARTGAQAERRTVGGSVGAAGRTSTVADPGAALRDPTRAPATGVNRTGARQRSRHGMEKMVTGSLSLDDISNRFRMLEVRCGVCTRRDRLRIDKFIDEHGRDMSLPDLRAVR